MASLRSLSFVFCALCLWAAGAERARAYTQTQLALDNVRLNFTSGSSPAGAAWQPHTTYADCLDDTDGLKAGSMGIAGESWVTATVTGPDTIDFMWALSTTAGNTLTCSIDGVVQTSCQPRADLRWYFAAVTVPEGQHTVRWNYKQTGQTGSRVLLDCVGSSLDNWASLTSTPWVQVLLGEQVAHTFTSKQPAMSWEVYWDSLPPGLTLDAATGQITGVPLEAGIWRPLIRISSPAYALYYRILVEVLDQPTMLSALESPALQFTTSASDGTSVWKPQAHGARDNGDCIFAGAPPPERRTAPFLPGWSSLETEVNGPDILSCWLCVANGRLTLLMDGRQYLTHRANQALAGWQRVWLTIPSGRHRVTWKYEPFQGRTPTAWLDEIRLRSDGRVFLQHQPAVMMQENGTVSHAVPFSGTALAWTATGLPAGLSLDPGSGSLTGTTVKRGVWSTRLFVNGPTGDRDDVMMVVDTSIPPGQALDYVNSQWDTGGDPGAKWFGQNALSHDGTDAMRSPPAPPDSARSLTTVVQGPATVRWWWHIPAASAGDSCVCVLDGAGVLAGITGVSAWQQAAATIPEGVHNLSWRWKTDATGDPETEAVIVDQVSYTP